MIFKNLFRRKGRTILTLLGIAIGVAAIIGLAAAAGDWDDLARGAGAGHRGRRRRHRRRGRDGLGTDADTDDRRDAGSHLRPRTVRPGISGGADDRGAGQHLPGLAGDTHAASGGAQVRMMNSEWRIVNGE